MGDWLALVLPLVVAATSGDFIKLLIVLGVLLFIQHVMLNLLSPRILGSSVRMPAMLVVVAVVVGARLTGITGALLGVPTMGVIYTLAVHYGVVIRRLRDIRERSARSRRAMEARRARASREGTDATRSEPVALPEPVDPAGSEPERAPLIEWTEFPADWVSGETTQAEPVASAEAEDSAEGETEQAEPVALVAAEDSTRGRNDAGRACWRRRERRIQQRARRSSRSLLRRWRRRIRQRARRSRQSLSRRWRRRIQRRARWSRQNPSYQRRFPNRMKIRQSLPATRPRDRPRHR